jgi:hypothetical protein
VHWKMLMMATYVPDNNSPDVAVHMVDHWRKTKPPKKQKTRYVDEDGFEVIQRRMRALNVHDANDEEDEDEEIHEEEEEEEEEDCSEFDPDALREISSRYIEEPVYRYEKYRTPEDIVMDLVTRPVGFKPTKRLTERLAVRDLHNLTAADRKKLIKSWGELLQQDAIVDLDQQTEEYRAATAIDLEYCTKVDAAVLRSASAIGMTTNGAAKLIRCGTAHSLF